MWQTADERWRGVTTDQPYGSLGSGDAAAMAGRLVVSDGGLGARPLALRSALLGDRPGWALALDPLGTPSSRGWLVVLSGARTLNPREHQGLRQAARLGRLALTCALRDTPGRRFAPSPSRVPTDRGGATGGRPC